MLLAFRVSNHRSFRDGQDFSLLTPGPRTLPNEIGGGERYELWKKEVEPVAGIYGANASGKSNLIDAISFMRRAVVDSFARWSPSEGVPTQPFLLDGSARGGVSFFEVEVVLWDGIRYQYGFRLDSKRVVEEWLYAYPRNRRQVWYERNSGSSEEFYFGKNFVGKNRTIAGLVRPNSLFLSVAAANGHEQVGPLHHWFHTHLRVVVRENYQSRLNFTIRKLQEPQSRDKILRMIKSADLGITGINVKVQEVDAKDKEHFRAIYRAIKNDLDDVAVEQELMDYSRKVELQHSTSAGTSVEIPFEMESLGTQSWFALSAPVISVLDGADVLFVDELDASLHPTLAAELVSMFRDPEINRHHAQLVFNAHNSSLLGNIAGDPALLRGQIWFTEKDDSGASSLVPLTDFRPRKPENIERGYLQGRYVNTPIVDLDEVRGAVSEGPALGNDDKIELHGVG